MKKNDGLRNRLADANAQPCKTCEHRKGSHNKVSLSLQDENIVLVTNPHCVSWGCDCEAFRPLGY